MRPLQGTLSFRIGGLVFLLLVLTGLYESRASREKAQRSPPVFAAMQFCPGGAGL
jgi:hypothetical protein